MKFVGSFMDIAKVARFWPRLAYFAIAMFVELVAPVRCFT